MASSGGSDNCCPKRYIDQLVKPTMAPTERSNWPPIMSRVTPTATIPNCAARLVAGTNIAVLRKSGVTRLKKIKAATTPAIEADSDQIRARRARSRRGRRAVAASSPPFGCVVPRPAASRGRRPGPNLITCAHVRAPRRDVRCQRSRRRDHDRGLAARGPGARQLGEHRHASAFERRRGSARSGSPSPGPSRNADSGRAASRRCTRANIPAGRW